MGAKIFDALMMRPIGWVAYFSLIFGGAMLFGAVGYGESDSVLGAAMWGFGLVLGLIIGFILGARRMRAFMLRSADAVLVHGDPQRLPALSDGAGYRGVTHEAAADPTDRLRSV